MTASKQFSVSGVRLIKHPYSRNVMLLEVYADPGNNEWYYREQKPDSMAKFIRYDVCQAEVSAHMEKCAAVCDDLGNEFVLGGSPTSQAVLKIASDRIRKELQLITLGKAQP